MNRYENHIGFFMARGWSEVLTNALISVSVTAVIIKQYEKK